MFAVVTFYFIHFEIYQPLARLCNAHGITLCAGRLESVEHGVSFGFGSHFALWAKMLLSIRTKYFLRALLQKIYLNNR